MELRQLAYFVAVAEEANFTRAAERVHISQSGVSAQIRQLEHELGAALIDRSGRTATLTTAGAAALDHARSALASADALRQAVDDVNGVVRGHLVVGMVTGCTITPLFDALAAFRHEHPGVEISVLEDNSARLVESVRSGDADMALVGTAGAPAPDLEALTIVSEGLVAVVPPDHPLAQRARVTVAQLGEHPIVCMPAGTGIRAVLDQAFAAHGLRPDVALQASVPDAIADLAARGLGVGVLSASMAARYEGLEAIRIEGIRAPAVLALVWPRTPSPALGALLSHAREAFGASPSPADRTAA
jgi:DNA-binding transcriptional LysR family regulator